MKARMNRMMRLITIVEVAALLWGCRAVAPNYTRPLVKAPDAFRGSTSTLTVPVVLACAFASIVLVPVADATPAPVAYVAVTVSVPRVPDAVDAGAVACTT